MGFLGIAVAVYGIFIALLYFGQRNLLYHPDQTVPRPADYGVGEMEPIRLKTSDGLELLAWWRPAATAQAPVIAYFHGNAGHIGIRGDKVRAYLDAGYGVLLLSYRYNAGAGGSPAEDLLFSDAGTALGFLRSEGIPDNRIVLYGESLGSGIAVAMAVKHAVGAVVLEAPYSSMPDLAQHHYWYAPSRWLVRDRFDSVSRIAAVTAPLLIVHGEHDTVIPVKYARRLFDAANEPKVFHLIAGARHNNLLEHGLPDIVLKFLEKMFPEAEG
ncbi:MAG: alpha/beta hydrolase [Alphaproteobacteria bacterium]